MYLVFLLETFTDTPLLPSCVASPPAQPNRTYCKQHGNRRVTHPLVLPGSCEMGQVKKGRHDIITTTLGVSSTNVLTEVTKKARNGAHKEQNGIENVWRRDTRRVVGRSGRCYRLVTIMVSMSHLSSSLSPSSHRDRDHFTFCQSPVLASLSFVVW